MSTQPTILSLNVGGPREVQWNGKPVSTGFYKSPTPAPVLTANNQLAGDHQADPRVHGGPDKAVYAFPSEHYPHWRERFPGSDWPWGAFGENLTLTGLLEQQVCLGDRFRCGTIVLEARQPRMPCFKFAIRVGDNAAIEEMISTGHTGFYFGILTDGTTQAGDTLDLVAGPSFDGTPGLTMHAFNVLSYANAENPTNPADLRTALASPALPEKWRERLTQRLAPMDPG